ncbi:MAG: HAMP domain-containing sensor histidine kinase [Bacillota bacterium]|nr:HAMP domain-containing sensor histidine kinase [Bacillota bacterium]
MQKTLFKKQLAIGLLIVLVSFLILGITLLFFISRYWEGEKESLLLENANEVSNLCQSSSIQNGVSISPKDPKLFQTVITAMAKSIGADIFLADKDGIVEISSGQNSDVKTGSALPKLILTSALSKANIEDSTLGGFYKSNYYTASVPITITENGQQSVYGIVFVSMAHNDIYNFTTRVMTIFILAAIMTFVIVSGLVWYFSFSLVRPLRQIAKAAKSFGSGDFEVRVPVKSKDEIGQLSEAFNNMADSLTQSESARRSFIANVSHELKTPMTTISGFIDGILDGTIEKDKQSFYLKLVSEEIKRLSRLVTSMLALSRIDNGELRLNKQRFDLTETLINTLITFEQKIEERHLKIFGLDDMESLFVNGDSDLMHQVIYNLVENAVKFTNENGYIKVKAYKTNEAVFVEIQNSGEGILPEELSFIFDKFYKTDKSRSRDKYGMGLGLYIVRTIIRLHGGNIYAESVAGEHCKFTFWIPN